MARFWKGSIGGLAIVATMAALPFARSTAASRTPVLPSAAGPEHDAGPAPLLSHLPRRIVVKEDSPAIVTVTGAHFATGVTLSLESIFFDATFDAQAFTSWSSTHVAFDACALPDGTYVVVARDAIGRTSNAMTLTVVHE